MNVYTDKGIGFRVQEAARKQNFYGATNTETRKDFCNDLSWLPVKLISHKELQHLHSLKQIYNNLLNTFKKNTVFVQEFQIKLSLHIHRQWVFSSSHLAKKCSIFPSLVQLPEQLFLSLLCFLIRNCVLFVMMARLIWFLLQLLWIKNIRSQFINRCGKMESFPGKYGIWVWNDGNFC